MGTKRKIENCTNTFEVCGILARAIRKMPEYNDCFVETYGPFGVWAESSVFVERGEDVVGSIHIHRASESESGFSYGGPRDNVGSVDITEEKPLPKDIAAAVECVFEKAKLEAELAPIVKGLSDEGCIKLHNEITNVGTHRVYSTVGMGTRTITDAEGKKVMPSLSLAFDKCAPYYVVDIKNPDEPFYRAKYELRSVYHYDEIYNSPYEKIRLTPREMLAGNLATLGYADRVLKMALGS